MTPDISVVASYITVIVGLVIMSYFGRERNLLRTGLGLLCAILGVIFVAGIYSLIPSVAVNTGAVLGIFVFVFLLYLDFGRNFRTLLLLPIPFLFFVQAFVFPVPLLSIFIYFVLSVTILAAIDYSEADMMVLMRNADKYLRGCLLPFVLIQRLVKSVIGRSSRTSLAIAYFALFSLVLLAVPLIVSDLSNGLIRSEFLLTLALAYLLLSDEQYRRGRGRL